ncbi:LPS export ABC transporter periplasmic protein LptC [Gammaproteobacteria bacterium]|nr:LPS export ABC transporter periplasmic protein LptC [Gammaproteobacteria bacterium]MDC0222050.1 LPS export ABC transporter periplasmic protein LptC [Gammaproteobacteria bacterium]|tara:strand:- start:978 stop:1565 length:588 start_codon:yes stop_codon:yes gene_type:complete
MQRHKLLLIPSLLAILIFLAISAYDSVSVNLEDTGSFTMLDYNVYSEGFNTVLYNLEGEINYTLRAKNQTHYNDNHTELEKPFIRLFQDGKSRWNIVANNGRIPADLTENTIENRNIELSGNVEVFSIDNFGNRTVMSTEFLELNPQNKTLETNQAIRLVTSTLQQSSTGMFADLKIDKIIFHRDIRGYYEKTNN